MLFVSWTVSRNSRWRFGARGPSSKLCGLSINSSRADLRPRAAAGSSAPTSWKPPDLLGSWVGHYAASASSGRCRLTWNSSAQTAFASRTASRDSRWAFGERIPSSKRCGLSVNSVQVNSDLGSRWAPKLLKARSRLICWNRGSDTTGGHRSRPAEFKGSSRSGLRSNSCGPTGTDRGGSWRKRRPRCRRPIRHAVPEHKLDQTRSVAQNNWHMNNRSS